MGGFFPISGWPSGWCVIGADAGAALPQPRSQLHQKQNATGNPDGTGSAFRCHLLQEPGAVINDE
jgi:hypothetical protein